MLTKYTEYLYFVEIKKFSYMCRHMNVHMHVRAHISWSMSVFMFIAMSMSMYHLCNVYTHMHK